jgi:poly(hydroxyalkanoate) depolymerase family esterase
VLAAVAGACGACGPAARVDVTALPHTQAHGSADGLDYQLYLPAAGAAGRPPLLVMLHGCLQDAASFSAATHMLRHARDAVVLYPEQAAAANPQRCWNWFDPASQQRDGGEAAQLAALTRRIAAAHGVDPRRIYVAGISAGGMMAAILAATHADIYAALGVHSAGAFPTAATVAEALAVMRGDALDDAAAVTAADAALRAMGAHVRSMPVIIVHGRDDEVVRVANAEHAAQSWWRVHARATGTQGGPDVAQRSGAEGGRAFTVASYASAAGAAPVVELWRITGLGHAWSGGVEGGSYADPAGPDAAQLMLRFLRQQRRP